MNLIVPWFFFFQKQRNKLILYLSIIYLTFEVLNAVVWATNRYICNRLNIRLIFIWKKIKLSVTEIAIWIVYHRILKDLLVFETLEVIILKFFHLSFLNTFIFYTFYWIFELFLLQISKHYHQLKLYLR